MTHTPTPWQHIGRSYFDRIQGPDGALILDAEIDAENAAFICRAVNAHDELVAALEQIAGYPHAEHAGLPLNRCRTLARAALAKAKE